MKYISHIILYSMSYKFYMFSVFCYFPRDTILLNKFSVSLNRLKPLLIELYLLKIYIC